jgi:hypothetical protein
MDKLTELKAEAYDCISVIEAHQMAIAQLKDKLGKLNRQIVDLRTKQGDGHAGILDK